MTDIVGPFDTSTWSDTDWARHMLPVIRSGVIDAPQSSPTAGGLALLTSGLNVGLDQGRANVGAFGFSRTGAQTANVAVPANTNSTLYRRDRLVLRRSLATNTIAPVLIQGTAAATPVAPSITQTDTVWDLPMFSFLVPPASGTILSGFIDERGWLSTASPLQGLLSLVGGWEAYPGYHGPTWYLASDGWATLSGMVRRTGSDFALGSGDAYQFANLPPALTPSATVSPSTGWVGVGTGATLQSFPCRIHVPVASNFISVVGMDSGTGVLAQNKGLVNIDGVRWHI